MNASELAELKASNVFELSAHTVTHPSLSKISPGERRKEISQSRRECELLTGASVPGFSYPYGDTSRVVQKDVADSGFQWACTTVSESVNPSAFDVFSLPRLSVEGWSLATLADTLGPS